MYRIEVKVLEIFSRRVNNSRRRSKNIINISRINTSSSSRSNIGRINISSRSRNLSKIIISSSSMRNLSSNIRRKSKSNRSINISSRSGSNIIRIIYTIRSIIIAI